MSVLLGVSKETVASSWMAADRSTGHRRYQDEAERSGPPVVFLVIQIISPCLPVVVGSVRPLDDFYETARAKKTPGFSPGVHRDGVSREYWPRSVLRHERGVQPSACLAKRMLDRGEFPLVHHPEEQPVEIGLELDQAVIAL